MNSGMSRDEIDKILYNRKVFLGITEVLDRYVNIPLSREGREGRKGRDSRRLAYVPY